MNDNEKMIDQSLLAESVSEKIPYTFTDSILVKPLDKIMVKKEVTILPDTKPVKDSEGVEAVEGEPKTEVKEVESDFSKGIILKLPINYDINLKMEEKEGRQFSPHYNIGDVIVYKTISAKPFDLLKDSKLLRSYDIVAIVDND